MTIPVEVEAYSFCILPNGYLLSSNYGSITLFDENFQVIKRIDTEGFIFGCALNHRNEIYISNYNEKSIKMMNLDLNVIKSLKFCLSNPKSICCNNQNLYVCCLSSKIIHVLTLDLEFFDNIILDYIPVTISASDTVIGVCGENGTYFYCLKTKNLLKNYPDLIGRMSFIKRNFYVISRDPSKQFSCYNNEGSLIDEANIDKLGHFIKTWWDGYCFTLDNHLFIHSKSEKCVLKF